VWTAIHYLVRIFDAHRKARCRDRSELLIRDFGAELLACSAGFSLEPALKRWQLTQLMLEHLSTTAAVSGDDHPALYALPRLYDRAILPGPCEAFYRDVARQAAGPVLELGCGTGRLTVPLARDGHPLVGLDASPAMLDAARAKARAAKLAIEFVLGDMRNFNLCGRFGLIIVSCNSLAHLLENDALRACFRCIARHLAPNGRLAFDIVNPNVTALARADSEIVRLDQGPNPSSAIAVEEQAVYEPVLQVREAIWRVCDHAGATTELAPLRLRQIFPQELPLLLESAGLELLARYGSFERTPLSGASLNQVCIAGVAGRHRTRQTAPQSSTF
jgi:SAM-dependent methyltransferase